MMRWICYMVLGFTLLSFKKDESVFGIWQGAYGVGDSVANVVVTFHPNNTVDVYDGTVSGKTKMSGTYFIQGDTAVVFSYQPKNSATKVWMQGNLNKTKNFVDGIWKEGNEYKGSFYLQKQKSI